MVAVCPNLFATGTCTKQSCDYRHNVKICRPCGVVCYSAGVYDAHLRDRRHQKVIDGLSTVLHCSVCNINVVGLAGWTTHVQGNHHSTVAEQRGLSPDTEPEKAVALPGFVRCNVCHKDVSEEHWARHSSTRSHRGKVAFVAFEAASEEAGRNKHGITLSHDKGVDFGIVEVKDSLGGVSVTLEAQNIAASSRVTLVEARLSSAASNKASSFSVSLEVTPSVLVHGQPIGVKVEFRQAHLGRYEDRIELVFDDTARHQRFVIVRSVKGTVGSNVDHELLKPKAPYVPRQRTERDTEAEVVRGVRPPALDAIPYTGTLPRASIPQNISLALSNGSTFRVVRQFRDTFLPSRLDGATYGRHFKALLWAEEYRMERDMQMYDIPDARLTKHNQYFYLPVPGLAEKRPSVLIGDRIHLQPHGSKDRKWFEGYVHVVRKEEIGLRLHMSYREHQPNKLYNVRFTLNRTPLRRQHQALDSAFHPDRLLFPLPGHVATRKIPSSADIKSHIYNKLITTNPAQIQAVASIVDQKPGTAPFIVFGPPGTGKTVTIVEAIRQVLRANPQARVLACAPSNSAADLIATRLSTLSTTELFRFYAPSRFKDDVPDALRPYYCITSSGHFSVPSVEVLKGYRVIVSTCVSAGFSHGVGMPRGHFTHIFVDEAGHANEPEVMIPIKTMADNNTNVVISGDPKQLGPIVRSAVARELGFERSYLERLMNREAYDEKRFYGLSVVKLVQNFRSHGSILRFPNERFYKGDLRPHGDPKIIDSFIGSPCLVSGKFPIVFHGISGRDIREASSPSFFNIDEVTQVKEYVRSLRSDRRFRITDADIGIITPYHAQCLRIRAVLRAFADSVKVGSVEEFQGQERRVIIISTVRSSREFIEYDLRHTLGFVANPRRFNVAVTRAQALLIVVGDPSVLSLDPLWRSFLNYVHVRGGWRGDAPTWDTSAEVDHAAHYDHQRQDAEMANMDDFARRMELLTLEGLISNAVQDDEDANVDRPWREVE
ncbi:P-loop containing nucleoside triphosphate hydrolase protein [Amylocystis lapponica]|nr:P-loop containing nucleoside triphosphate hydrolase protein [Amylocystis lapponica]